VVLSINLIIGYCGLLDMGRAAFVGLGGYFSAIVMMKLHFPFFLAFLSAGLFCAFVGALLGGLCRNSTFDYLTLITIGFSEIRRLMFLNLVGLT
ncbi:MAG: branched-chain amino acid ABC transporter permease, partial [Clostridiales bacterium]|nr:branched-chain amino acid ABC transporter permease [Clostridiales bacterium]